MQGELTGKGRLSRLKVDRVVENPDGTPAPHLAVTRL